MRIETVLHDEIADELANLGKMEIGEEKYKVTVDGVTKLIDRAIELDKLNIESQDRIKNQEIDIDLRLKQMEEERKDRMVKNYIAVAGIALPLVVTVWGALKSWEFEKEGTVTTLIGRGFINKLLPKK